MVGVARMAALAAALTLSGCDAIAKLTGGGHPSAEETCSSQATYDALTGILSAQAQSAASLLGTDQVAATAASPASMKNVLGYSSPTVDDVNKNTGKISCKALLRVNAPTSLLSDTHGLSPNDFGPDHITYAIGYSVQPTADNGTPLMSLDSASALAGVALQASLAALRSTQQSTVAPAPEQQYEDDQAAEEPQPTADDAQAQDRMNIAQPAVNETASPPGDDPDAGNHD